MLLRVHIPFGKRILTMLLSLNPRSLCMLTSAVDEVDEMAGEVLVSLNRGVVVVPQQSLRPLGLNILRT